TAAEIARATITATYYRLAQILGELENSLGKMKRIIVSGGVLHSRASLRLLADALGRDLEISTEPEASLGGAAVHALRQLGVPIKTPRPKKTIRHNPGLSRLHQARRHRQIELE